jgi:hypothetical protein
MLGDGLFGLFPTLTAASGMRPTVLVCVQDMDILQSWTANKTLTTRANSQCVC